MMANCLKDIHNIGAGYEKAKGYCRASYNTLEAPVITDVKTVRKPGSYYKYGEPNSTTSTQT